ncbi:MAG: NADH-ubiquinone oxidoreductase chain B, partial [uncultured Friedmanniella sp.]
CAGSIGTATRPCTSWRSVWPAALSRWRPPRRPRPPCPMPCRPVPASSWSSPGRSPTGSRRQSPPSSTPAPGWRERARPWSRSGSARPRVGPTGTPTPSPRASTRWFRSTSTCPGARRRRRRCRRCSTTCGSRR